MSYPVECAECHNPWESCACEAGPFATPVPATQVPEEPPECPDEQFEMERRPHMRAADDEEVELKKATSPGLSAEATLVDFERPPTTPVRARDPGDDTPHKVFVSKAGLGSEIFEDGVGVPTFEAMEVPADYGTGGDGGAPPIKPDPERERLEMDAPSEMDVKDVTLKSQEPVPEGKVRLPCGALLDYDDPVARGAGVHCEVCRADKMSKPVGSMRATCSWDCWCGTCKDRNHGRYGIPGFDPYDTDEANRARIPPGHPHFEEPSTIPDGYMRMMCGRIMTEEDARFHTSCEECADYLAGEDGEGERVIESTRPVEGLIPPVPSPWKKSGPPVRHQDIDFRREYQNVPAGYVTVSCGAVIPAAEAYSHELCKKCIEADALRDARSVDSAVRKGIDERLEKHVAHMRDVYPALAQDFKERLRSAVYDCLGVEVLACAFCGEEYQGEKPVPRAQLAAHIRQCSVHPLVGELRAKRRELEDAKREAHRCFAEARDFGAVFKATWQALGLPESVTRVHPVMAKELIVDRIDDLRAVQGVTEAAEIRKSLRHMVSCFRKTQFGRNEDGGIDSGGVVLSATSVEFKLVLERAMKILASADKREGRDDV